MIRPIPATDVGPAPDDLLCFAALGKFCRENARQSAQNSLLSSAGLFGLDSRGDTSAASVAGQTTVAGDLRYAREFGTLSVRRLVPDSQTSTVDPVSRVEDRIGAAPRHEEIIDAINVLGHRTIADRLRYLHGLAEDDDEPAMSLASLRKLALFLVSQGDLVVPEIGLGPDGMLQAQWRLSGGMLAMKFMPDDLIQFAAVSGRAFGEGRRRRVRGTLPKDEVLAAVRRFLPAEAAP